MNEQSSVTQKKWKQKQAATLQGDIMALSLLLQRQATILHKKLCTRNARSYWKTRGRQQLLRHISTRLQTMQAQYSSPLMLYLALKEFFDYCLDKYDIDAYEERSVGCHGNTCAIQQWKAEGEAQELPAIRKALSRIVKAHTPRLVSHVLSLNGTKLVLL